MEVRDFEGDHSPLAEALPTAGSLRSPLPAGSLPEIEAYRKKMHALPYLLSADCKRQLLLCLQGKDAAINHVLSVMNPQDCTFETGADRFE